MPLPAGTVEYTFEFSGSSAPTGAAVTLAASVPSASPDDAVAIVSDLIAPVHAASSTITCNLHTVKMKIGPDATGPTYSGAGPGAGAQSGELAPPQTAILIHKVNPVRSARYNGRMFWPGVAMAGITAGDGLEETYLDPIQEAWDAFFLGLQEELDSTPQIVSATSSDTNPVGLFVVDPKVATQRRRVRR